MKYTSTDAVIDALATYRATRLVIDDEITADLRDRANVEIGKLDPKVRDKLRYFLTCPWCVSIWAAAFLLALRFVAPNLAKYLNGLLAASAATGIAYTKL